MGFPHTLSGAAIFLYLFVYESHVFVTWGLYWKGEDPGNECLSVAAFHHDPSRVLSVGESFRLVFLV